MKKLHIPVYTAVDIVIVYDLNSFAAPSTSATSTTAVCGSHDERRLSSTPNIIVRKNMPKSQGKFDYTRKGLYFYAEL